MKHRRRFERYLADEQGGAAAEFGMMLVLLVPILINLIDIGAYLFQRIQIENAAQAGAQAAFVSWPTCHTRPPTVSICPNFMSAVSSAVQSTGLGSSIQYTTSGNIYCPDPTTKALTVSTTPGTDCAASLAVPSYYYKVRVTYSFHSMIAGASVASIFPATIVSETWTRLE